VAVDSPVAVERPDPAGRAAAAARAARAAVSWLPARGQSGPPAGPTRGESPPGDEMSPPGGAPEPIDPVLEWYDRTARAVATRAAELPPDAGTNPPEGSRIWAIAWLAALRGLRDARRGRAATAAVIAAVHEVLVTLVPSTTGELDAARDVALGRLKRRRAITRGVEAGRLAAADVLAERSDDGPHPATWRPYLIASVAHVAPEPPPGPEHPAYARDLAEVRMMGGAASPVRDARQTEVAEFWAQPSLTAYTPAVRESLAGLAAPIAERVELVALLHVVTLDAQIAGYAAGEQHPRWRPGRALGGPSRTAWTSLITPDVGEPEYPCLHTAYAGAAEIVLTALAGHPRAQLPLWSPTAPGVVRHYTDWRQLTAECVDAGVWGGVHLRTSAEAGASLGRRVAFRCLTRWSGQAA
jgi:hypothetical protein